MANQWTWIKIFPVSVTWSSRLPTQSSLPVSLFQKYIFLNSYIPAMDYPLYEELNETAKEKKPGVMNITSLGVDQYARVLPVPSKGGYDGPEGELWAGNRWLGSYFSVLKLSNFQSHQAKANTGKHLCRTEIERLTRKVLDGQSRTRTTTSWPKERCLKSSRGKICSGLKLILSEENISAQGKFENGAPFEIKPALPKGHYALEAFSNKTWEMVRLLIM